MFINNHLKKKNIVINKIFITIRSTLHSIELMKNALSYLHFLKLYFLHFSPFIFTNIHNNRQNEHELNTKGNRVNKCNENRRKAGSKVKGKEKHNEC